MMKSLSLDTLCKTFRFDGQSVKAVDGFTAQIEQGEIVAVVGESGSGKSTVARMIVGLERPTSGSVRLTDSAGMRTPTLKDVQMVFQDPFASLNPVHTVRTHLARPIRKLRETINGRQAVDAECERLLEHVELNPASLYIDRYPDSMSGGQRQRVAIARALAAKPDFLIADEPTSMLDVSIRHEVLMLLKSLKADGLGIVLITHDLKSVEAIADRVFVLKKGVCVESGTTSDVLQRPTHDYTRLLCASVPDPDGLFLNSRPSDGDALSEEG
ncbi:MAG: dipeptide/oligopeptide/nickel ABC transporter ATP-binding protein [Myxococcales bacterium]|nr:dipeptide/oligopeptide/nickel ABC transporter ATP-binding protein [Myxococcales bacterium]|tara:strand:+ start:79 stop:891 length:813 start_codon:yes stop_codon:yes gene_type:complete